MRIFAIGAHPDDIEFGCGGSLIHFREKADAEIIMMVMSKGKRHKSSVGWREDEQQRAAEIIGAKCAVLDMDDTQLDLKECIHAIEDSLADLDPTHVFTVYPDDTHQDHRTLAQATISAMRESTNLLFYESISTEGMRAKRSA